MLTDDSKLYLKKIYMHVSTEGIKRRELEKIELRPLYMDFQATTPMGSILYDYWSIFLRRMSGVDVKQ